MVNERFKAESSHCKRLTGRYRNLISNLISEVRKHLPSKIQEEGFPSKTSQFYLYSSFHTVAIQGDHNQCNIRINMIKLCLNIK